MECVVNYTDLSLLGDDDDDDDYGSIRVLSLPHARVTKSFNCVPFFASSTFSNFMAMLNLILPDLFLRSLIFILNVTIHQVNLFVIHHL